MKRFAIVSIVLIMFCSLTVFYVYPLTLEWRRLVLMSHEKVCQEWGEHPLDTEKFKAAENNEDTRAEMACSLLENQNEYVGKSSIRIRNMFGIPDGIFRIDEHPAYKIGSAEGKEWNIWQIVFLVDQRNNVSEIVVHKNCCYN